MRRERSSRIVATLGPSSATEARIDELINAGVDVFRLNFSHGTPDDHRARLKTIRKLEKRHNRPITVMADLQGPKLRVGRFASDKVTLKPGQAFRLDLDDKIGDQTRAPLPHPEIFAALSPGDDLLLDDGKLRLKVKKCDASRLTRKSFSGASFPTTRVSTFPAPCSTCRR